MSTIDGSESLSQRARENVQGDDHWAPLVQVLSNTWSKENPNGTVILGVAENALMHNELAKHVQDNFSINKSMHFTYGHGPQGSPRLRNALSSFFNSRFHPQHPTSSNEFLVTAGVTAMIDHLTWCLCNEGEGLLLPQPLYTGFTNDIPTRSRGRLVPVSFRREDGSVELKDVFDAEANAKCLERAWSESERKGVKIKGVLISNPHNPLGKCYPPESIKSIARFCAKYKLHYLSDEIYAMSTFANPAFPHATPFTSVLSIEGMDDIIDTRKYVHVLYGAAKDFCANGLRLGALHSRSEALRRGVLSILTFAWEAYLVQDTWARILEDEPFLDYFISENQRRLAHNYTLVTAFLDKHNIRYLRGGNAGIFLWIDLRPWLLEQGDDQDHLRELTGPDSEKFKEKERRLDRLWKTKGVMLAMGSNFLSEELGGFRMVFTAEEAALKVGLERFVAVLKEWKKVV